MAHILIQHYLTDEDKDIIMSCIKDSSPIWLMIGESPMIRCKDCKYREKTENGDTYYCGYEYERCDPYEMTRSANDPNYFCGDAVRKDG